MHEEFWIFCFFFTKLSKFFKITPLSPPQNVFVYELIPSNTMARKPVLLLQAYQMGGAIICHYL